MSTHEHTYIDALKKTNQINSKQETLVHAPKLWAEEISTRASMFP